MSNKKLHVVVAGGGYAGIKASLELSKHSKIKVTLVTDYPSMRVYPSLYHTATGGSKEVADVPLKNIFSGKNVEIIYDTAVSVDRTKQELITKRGNKISYSALVLALGVKTNYFGIEGLSEYSYGIKTLDEAEKLKAHLHTQLLQNGTRDSNYVVVGGGPTGIELAGVLPKYIREISKYHDLPDQKIHIDLIEAAPRLLPRMPKSVSRSVSKNLRKQGVKIYLNTIVQAQTADALIVHGKPIRSHTVVWTAGMANNSFFKENNFQLTSSGKVRVDLFLQAERGIYVLGDNADTPYSGMAQTALHDGKFIASNLKRLADKQEPLPYRPKKPIYVMPAGPKWAAVVWGRARIYGRMGWMLRRIADYIAYNDYEPWVQASKRFIAENNREESCPLCIDDLSLTS